MAAVLPLPPLVVPARRPNPRVIGFLVGAAVPALVACAAWWLGAGPVAVIAGAGVPIGALIGAALGHRWLDDAWFVYALLGALVAPLVAGAVVLGALVVGWMGSPTELGPEILAGFVVLAGFVFVFAELIGGMVTLPVAIVVGFLAHRAARMTLREATLHVGLLVLAAAVAVLATAVGVLGSSPVDPWLSL